MTPTVVVVGAGLAGGNAALALRSKGFDGRVIVVGDEDHPPYSRPPLSKQLIRGEFEVPRVHLRPAPMWEKREIEFMLGRAVSSLDAAAHRVVLSDGEPVAYDAVLLATGGRARTLPGHKPVDGVYVLRTIDDALAIRQHLGPGKRLLIVGAGFVGAELAASAAMLGTHVTALEAAGVPLGRGLPAALGEIYGRMHAAHGVDIRVNATVSEVVAGAGGLVATRLTDGTVFESDAVVVAIGLEPDVSLAAAAGLAVDNGIVVDEYCRTSAPDVYAAGDIANHPNPILGQRVRVEHWQNAQHQGAVAAHNIAADGPEAYEMFAEVPWVWSDQYDVNLQVAGRPLPTDEVVFRGDPGSREFSAMLLRDDVLIGAVGVNCADDVRAVRAAVGHRLRPDRLALADASQDLQELFHLDRKVIA
ncbi:pyridine nucleotide-disulfide oxidoreductase [Mycolicibacterium duvalii]|uniref:Pyridine nucleotide-disulfide oxidoreductase n=1 Tax=Mycolicibacterium duvalii TaxID=39688 RepID=A0A7I7JYW0_9MYCO|nr:FAD-dependent oxidoreductase [Mycolicibacterium duvalii]MCV7370828.1 FAD-dependent oxidoreductase [Mycolicibacterium duvalii]PEG41351.1 pyridine nucleotide-disulfide oxidoreductase [Mycolicibacterium duvalii]BBX17076.1 pyridine nucleotide-disulfide oxidoreductase [Mycolicibacterium duvalii]